MLFHRLKKAFVTWIYLLHCFIAQIESHSVIVDETKRWKHEELLHCSFVRLNIPTDLRPVAQFVSAALS